MIQGTVNRTAGETVEGTIEALAACLPASLAAFGRGLAPGPGGPGAVPVAALRDRGVFDGVIDAFAAGFARSDPAVDRRAVVSYWTQFYLAALVTPALTALLRLGRGLPLALDEIGFELDDACRPARFLLPEAPCADAAEPCLGTLVEGHLRPLCALCHAHAGLAPRVFWGNAGVILDHVARELDAGAGSPCAAPCATLRAARGEVATLLGWRAAAGGPTSPLGDTLRGAGDGGTRRRRVCCLRYRLPGVPSCGALCPVEANASA